MIKPTIPTATARAGAAIAVAATAVAALAGPAGAAPGDRCVAAAHATADLVDATIAVVDDLPLTEAHAEELAAELGAVDAAIDDLAARLDATAERSERRSLCRELPGVVAEFGFVADALVLVGASDGILAVAPGVTAGLEFRLAQLERGEATPESEAEMAEVRDALAAIDAAVSLVEPVPAVVLPLELADLGEQDARTALRDAHVDVATAAQIVLDVAGVEISLEPPAA